jgi:butyryl-CoA dehydrogenase
VNLWGVVHGTRAFLPQLFENGEGAVVNVSSIFGLVGPPVCSDYAASKFAVRGFTEALSAELQGSPITVHTVHPGGIRTNITRIERSRAFGERFLKTEPDDIARFVLDGIRKGRPRIVYGHRSLPANLGARLVPLSLVNRVVRWLMSDVYGDVAPPLGGRAR